MTCQREDRNLHSHVHIQELKQLSVPFEADVVDST